LTLYRTKKEGVFSDDDVFVMQCLSCHLSRLLEVEKQKENRAAGPSALRGERVRKLSASHGLTDRESEILSLLLKGSADRDIAESLSISEGTLKKHIQHIYRKLGISARWELIVFLSEDLY
jgi:DNA-binding NarL/FixJ family response regulator